MNLPTSFCMDAGQVKSGVDAKDTYLKMLQQIVRVTPPVAHGIVAQYPNVQSLVKALEEGGVGALQFIKVITPHLLSESALGRDGLSGRGVGGCQLWQAGCVSSGKVQMKFEENVLMEECCRKRPTQTAPSRTLTSARL